MLRSLCYDPVPSVDVLVNTHVVPPLVKLLSCGNDDTEFQSAWALTNIASDSTPHVDILISSGAVPALVQMFNKARKWRNREQAAWALSNIAADSCENRDLVLSYDIMLFLVKNLKVSKNMDFLRRGTCLMYSLVYGTPGPTFELVSSCFDCMYRLLHLEDEEILSDACWALSYVTYRGDENKIDAVIQAGLVPRLVKLMYSKNKTIFTPSLRVIGDVVAGSSAQTQAVLDADGLSAIRHLMEIKDLYADLLKTCCFTLSNIMGGTADQVDAVMESGICPLLFKLMKEGEPAVKKEATWAMVNALDQGNDQHVISLIHEGILDVLIGSLTSDDLQLVMLCLKGLRCSLKVGNNNSYGSRFILLLESKLHFVKLLQNHTNVEVAQSAYSLLDLYQRKRTMACAWVHSVWMKCRRDLHSSPAYHLVHV